MFNCKINISNLGPIPNASIELKNITVFVGKNNTGKTYLLNTLYYFQSHYFKSTLFDIIENSTSSFKITTQNHMKNINLILEDIFLKIKDIDVLSEVYIKKNENKSNKTSFDFQIPHINKSEIIYIITAFLEDKRLKPILQMFLSSTSNTNSKNILKLLNLGNNEKLRKEEEAEKIIGFLIKIFNEKQTFEIIIKAYLCMFFNLANESSSQLKSYLFPVERAGINKFFFESISRLNNVNLSLRSLIEFKVKLHNDTIKEDFRKSDFYEITRELEQKIFNGGKIRTEKLADNVSEIVFYDKKDARFTLDHFSSSINELSIIMLYLKYYAKKGDIVLIDEPELSLHPDSQRTFVKYISKLSKKGLKFIIITHSDYIVKEFNNIICLNSITNEIAFNELEEIEYSKDMSLSYEEINVYSIFEDENNNVSIIPAEKTPYGYDEKLFKRAINTIEEDSHKIFNLLDIKIDSIFININDLKDYSK